MGRMSRVFAAIVSLGLVVMTSAFLSACASRGAGLGAQVQPVEPDLATVQGGTPPPIITPPAPPPGVTISTPVIVPTQPITRPYPARDLRTPVVPTVPPATSVPPVMTRLWTPAPTHTPGPTPTNPPGEEQALRSIFSTALQNQRMGIDTTRFRIVIHSVRIEGDWGYLGLHLEYVSGGNVPGSGGLIIARKLSNQWQIVFAGDPEYRSWLEDMPDSLLTPQQRRWF